MSFTIEKIETYTKALFSLVAQKANISEFNELYADTFYKEPSSELKATYLKRINDDMDDTDDSYSYEESYSYDEDE